MVEVKCVTSAPLMLTQEAPAGGHRARQITRHQSQVLVPPSDKPLASEAEVPVAATTLPLFPSQTEQVSTKTQVIFFFNISVVSCNPSSTLSCVFLI